MAAYKKTNALFDLIHSLSRTEKRYFTVYASRHVIGNDNKYLMLFEAINKQPEYNEAELRKLFAKENFIKQLHQIKNYLYNLILSSLVLYNEEKTIEKRMRRLLSSIEILLDKGLYVQAASMIQTAKKKATRYDRSDYLLELHRYERKVIELGVTGRNISKAMKHMTDENKKAFDRFAIENNFWEISSEALGLLRSEGFAANKKLQEKYGSMIRTLAEPAVAERSSYRAKLFYLDAQTIFYAATGKTDKATAFAEKIIQVHEANWIQVEDRPQRYAATVNNFLILAGMQNNLPLLEKGINKLKKIYSFVEHNKNIADSTKAEIFTTYFLYQIKMFTLRGEFARIIELQKSFEENFRTIHYKTSYPKILTIYFYFSLACLAEKRLAEASKWINKVIEEDINKYPSIIIHARVLAMVVHYERDHFELVESLIKSHLYYLQKKSSETGFDKTAARYFKALIKPRTEKNKKKILDEFRKELLSLSNGQELTNRSAYFDILSWIRSKITGRSLGDLYKEKIKRSN